MINYRLSMGVNEEEQHGQGVIYLLTARTGGRVRLLRRGLQAMTIVGGGASRFDTG